MVSPYSVSFKIVALLFINRLQSVKKKSNEFMNVRFSTYIHIYGCRYIDRYKFKFKCNEDDIFIYKHDSEHRVRHGRKSSEKVEWSGGNTVSEPRVSHEVVTR